MKRFPSLLIVVIMAGFHLAACSNTATLVPTITPIQTNIPVPTLPNIPGPTQTHPTMIVTPTMMAEPSVVPTTISFTGTATSFDKLSLVIPSGVAAGGSGVLVPEVKKDEGAPWEVAPEHIKLTMDGYALEGKLLQPGIYVYPAEAYAQAQEYGAAAQSLERLRAVLAQGSMMNIKELPAVPFLNVPQALAAQVEVIPFQNGRGVRMLTQYAMARTIINNHELVYHFEGLTNDGQYYIIAILPVTAPGLPEDGQPGSAVPEGGVQVPDFNDMNANWLGYYGDVRQMLQGLEPEAFTPNLDQLDAFMESINIIPTSQ